jgi:hypothetical protein
MTAKDEMKIKYLSGLRNEDYSLRCTFHRIDEVQEAIRLNYYLSLSDMPVPFKVKGIDFIMFKTKSTGVIVDYVCMNSGDKFNYCEINLSAYNKYEQYMRKLTF